jgi:ATP-binding cassette subfamily B multidrug efflux pump
MSGSGKSTVSLLLPRFYDVQEGSITIDGVDITDATLDSLRREVGVVFEDAFLFSDSVRNNIAYGRPDATDEAVRRAAQVAGASVFIDALPNGYDTMVGERGLTLSGGQRQRIAIARVILKNAPILMLDEATSALDSEVEAAIQQSLGTLMAGKTVIAIAHRLSTIARMDRLVVLDRGRIVEQGTHDALLRANGHYAALWRRQSGGFIDAGETSQAAE